MSESDQEVIDKAKRLLEERYLKQAQEDGAADEVDAKLADKLQHIGGNSKTMQRLQELSGQASELWKNKGRLNRKQIIYLTAGLLYFISPVDAVTDLIPILGYIDDVAVLGWILSQIIPAASKAKEQVIEIKDAAIEQATDTLVDKGRVALNEVVDERTDEILDKLDDAAERNIRKSVAAVVIGLWGSTTGAAVSLALFSLTGGYSSAWLIWVLLSAGLVIIWNAAIALSLWRQFRKLDGRWQEKLPKLLGEKLLRSRYLAALGLPMLVFLLLAVAHITLREAAGL